MSVLPRMFWTDRNVCPTKMFSTDKNVGRIACLLADRQECRSYNGRSRQEYFGSKPMRFFAFFVLMKEALPVKSSAN